MSGPQEASADMRAFARQIRDMWVALTAEDFTDAQAAQIIAQVILAAFLANGGNS